MPSSSAATLANTADSVSTGRERSCVEARYEAIAGYLLRHEAAAAKDESGKPIANGARNTWVTETALATALNVSYMAEQIGLLSVVVGIALLLSGIGSIILALVVLGGGGRKPAAS
jgi:hypothetical protein